MSQKIEFSEVLFPIKANKLDYFKAAVYYLVCHKKPIFIECENEKSDLKDPKLNAIIKEAVPGCNSKIMRLVIMTNIHQHIIDDKSMELNEKIVKIADYIRKYVPHNVA